MSASAHGLGPAAMHGVLNPHTVHQGLAVSDLSGNVTKLLVCNAAVCSTCNWNGFSIR
jgi:hypothetical protein